MLAEEKKNYFEPGRSNAVHPFLPALAGLLYGITSCVIAKPPKQSVDSSKAFPNI